MKSMAEIAKHLTQLIGNTPMLELGAYSKLHGLALPIVAKLENFNPGGSAKDRVALAMIEDAERQGRLVPGATVIEPTSGNTGVGLALVATVKGYKVIITMPETMSVERTRLVKAYGARVVLTSGKLGMKGAIDAAERLRSEIPGAVILQQFENRANPRCHYDNTAAELWRQTDGNIDIFVAGVGTGGTISGVGRRLKELNPGIRIVAVQPSASPVLTGGKSAPHRLQGLGADFIPATYDADVVDEVVGIDSDDAILAGRQLASTEGLLVGISSGAAAYAAALVAKRPENEGKRIVTLLPDTGERYLTTVLYAFDEYPL